MNSFLAHSGELQNGADGQLLVDHLNQVGCMARGFAHYTPLTNFAEIAGLLHDLGKYSAEFQARIRGNPQRVNHATAGAVEAARKYGQLGKLLAFVIAGHHAGLANGIDEAVGRKTLQQRLKDAVPSLDPVWQSELALPHQLKPPILKPRPDFIGLQLAFRSALGWKRFWLKYCSLEKQWPSLKSLLLLRMFVVTGKSSQLNRIYAG